MESNFKVTLIGTLPPIKGISPYCKELLISLSSNTPVEFIGFKKLYPDFLYPGGRSTEDDILESHITIDNTEIRNTLTYYNPFSWIIAGLTCKGDIIHAQWWSHVLAPVFITILLLCKLRGKKVVITIHNILPHEANRLNAILNRAVLHLGDHFIVHSERNVAQSHNTLGIPITKISRIPIGIINDVDEIHVPQSVAKEKLHIPQEKKVILFFGHIREYKGLEVLLEAFSIVIQQDPNLFLVIAGTPWKNEQHYVNLIQKYNIGSQCKAYLHFVPSNETSLFYSASDVVVLPYIEFSSQSAVGAVALAYEKPLIVTDVGGLSEYVKDRRCLVPPKSPKNLAEAILSITRDENLLQKLALDSKSIAQDCSWTSVAERTVATYKRILTAGCRQ